MRRAEGLAAMRGVVQQGPGSCARSAVPPNNAAAARELREREATRLYQQVDDDRLGRCLEQESDEADEDAMVLAQFTPGMQLDSFDVLSFGPGAALHRLTARRLLACDGTDIGY